MDLLNTKEWLRRNKSGAVLLTCADDHLRSRTSKELIKSILCLNKMDPACDCSACYSVNENSNPNVYVIPPKQFDALFPAIKYYNTKLVLVEDVQHISYYKQTNLLIWLESMSGRSALILSAKDKVNCLSTLTSRVLTCSVVAEPSFSSDQLEQAKNFMVGLWTGRFDLLRLKMMEIGDQISLARCIISLINKTMSEQTDRGWIQAADKMNLSRILIRFLERPADHNLPLMIQAYYLSIQR